MVRPEAVFAETLETLNVSYVQGVFQCNALQFMKQVMPLVAAEEDLNFISQIYLELPSFIHAQFVQRGSCTRWNGN